MLKTSSENSAGRSGTASKNLVKKTNLLLISYLTTSVLMILHDINTSQSSEVN